MNARTTLLTLAGLLACLGCTEKPAPAVPAAPAVASAPGAVAASAPAVEAAAPVALDAYDATDALRLMPVIAFVRFKTEAGTLHCAPGLCEEAPDRKASEDNVIPLSTHKVKWTPTGAAVTVGATDGPSADPTYFVDERQIAGEDAYVPGDGCLYIRQSGNAFFPVTKRYCVGSNGKLERKPQNQGVFPLAHTARFEAVLQLFETPDSKEPVATVPENEQIFVMAARVEELDDWRDSFSWLQVRTQRGLVGWVRMPEPHLIRQCDAEAGNQRTVCFLGD